MIEDSAIKKAWRLTVGRRQCDKEGLEVNGG